MNPMPIILENPRFHGSLLGLIGKTVDEALKEAPGSARVNEGGKAQRLVWKEKGRDSETEKEFPLYLMARVYEGAVWAVGIWSERFAFLAEPGDAGWYFNAVGKLHIADFHRVNWISRENGEFINLGLGE